MGAAYALADHIAWVSDESLDQGSVPTAYVTTLPDGPAVVLEGPACLVWLALTESATGTVADVAAVVADIVEQDPTAITPDVEQLLEGLVTEGVARRR